MTRTSPHMIGYYGTYRYEEKKQLWMITEYCDCGSVNDFMRATNKTLTEDQIAIICEAALKACMWLHSFNEIHSNIKGAHVLLTSSGEVKLAWFRDRDLTIELAASAMMMIGSPLWMPPELIQSQQTLPVSDVWSIGITAIEMAEGKPPYSKKPLMRALMDIVSNPPSRLSEPDKWSTEFNDFVAKCLVSDPNERTTPVELLQHPFLTKERNSSTALQSLLNECQQAIKQRWKQRNIEGKQTKKLLDLCCAQVALHYRNRDICDILPFELVEMCRNYAHRDADE
eukprot:TRINITY_DN5852_c0_g1_i3.p1 TRINITY_DN5852_c0_g1~~TRINITY_DN5852_c0_g1_i3.p1  ORF type:complete len:284 (-),score=42.45 TRINITY_DN5852_c0_g1_i3:9-860(-)